MKKKLLSLVLALTMMLSMGTVAMADKVTGNYTISDATAEDNKITLKKNYTIKNNGTVSPAETFSFTELESEREYANLGVDAYDSTGNVKDYDIQISDVSFDAIAAAEDGSLTTETFTITLPKYDAVGQYTYYIKENAGTTAGVVYDINTFGTGVTEAKYKVDVIVTDDSNGTDKKLVATVNVYDMRNSCKSDAIDNRYHAGTLSVKKTVTGNMADRDKYFEVTVKFTAPKDLTVKGDITYDTNACGSYDSDGVENGDEPGYQGVAVEAGTNGWTGEKEVTILVKHDDTVQFNNIPKGVTYTVTEKDYSSDGYDEATYKYEATYKVNKDGDVYTVDVEDSKKMGDEVIHKVGQMSLIMQDQTYDHNVEITNNKDQTVDTGINLDSMPYILILAAVAVGGVAIISKKRREEF